MNLAAKIRELNAREAHDQLLRIRNELLQNTVFSLNELAAGCRSLEPAVLANLRVLGAITDGHDDCLELDEQLDGLDALYTCEPWGLGLDVRERLADVATNAFCHKASVHVLFHIMAECRRIIAGAQALGVKCDHREVALLERAITAVRNLEFNTPRELATSGLDLVVKPWTTHPDEEVREQARNTYDYLTGKS